MDISFSVRCGLPICQSEGEQQTWFSVALRLSALVLGTIAIIVGILALTGVPGLSQLGTIGGWSTLSAGVFTILLGASLKCVKSDRLDQKSQSLTNESLLEEPSAIQSENRQCLINGLNDWIKESPAGEKSSREKATEKILECFAQKDINLDLSELGLTSLPSELFQLSQLQVLSLSFNRLISLPSEIGQLRQLQELNLHMNRLTSLPPELFQLNQLQALFLLFNQLSELPKEIGQLRQLQGLYLEYNQLSSLPSEIGQLRQLIKLWLGHNQLRSLPPEFSQLNQLQELRLNNNLLTDFPPELFQLSQLQVLNLVFNRLISLPSEIGQLRQLQVLNLYMNRLTSLPPEIGQLRQLIKLWLEKNQLTSIPKEIGQLSHLNQLWLGHNQLRSLPPEIGQLSQLQELYLNRNQLTGLSNSIFNLGIMCQVSIEGNPFSQRVLENLRAAVNQSNYQGPLFFFSIQDRRQDSQFQSIEDSFNSLGKLAEKEIIKLQNLEKNETLRSWLSRLVDVKDYQGPTRKQLAKKIYDALILAEKDEIFREVFLNCIRNASETCGDRMALSILYIGLNLQIHKCEDLGELAYLLGHGTIALRELEIIAQNKVESLRFVDEIEVYLAYPVKLKEKLQIPIDIESMLYFSCSDITDDDLSIAEGIVRAILSNKKTYCQRLVENKIWQDDIDKHYPQHKKKRDEDFENGCDEVKIQQEYKIAVLIETQRILEENPPPFLEPANGETS